MQFLFNQNKQVDLLKIMKEIALNTPIYNYFVRYSRVNLKSALTQLIPVDSQVTRNILRLNQELVS